MTVHRTRVVDKIVRVAGEEVTLYTETDVFVNDAVAKAPTWMLVRTLWHFFPATGISLCGYVANSMGLYGAASAAQHYRNHTKRKRFERTVTNLCPKCVRSQNSTLREAR